MELNLYTDESGTRATLSKGMELVGEHTALTETEAKAWAYETLSEIYDDFAPELVNDSKNYVFKEVE
jgi:hypothetical protein